ncbi:MAG: hypothetical protein R3C44_24580 [Chloroflexota bacterium]
MVFTILGVLAILWGVATIFVGSARPQGLWNNSKIQGFVSLLSATGTTIFFVIIGLAAIALGLWLLIGLA